MVNGLTDYGIRTIAWNIFLTRPLLPIQRKS